MATDPRTNRRDNPGRHAMKIRVNVIERPYNRPRLAICLGLAVLAVFGLIAWTATAPWALVWGSLALVGLAVAALGILSGMAVAKRSKTGPSRDNTGPGRVRRVRRGLQAIGYGTWVLGLSGITYAVLGYFQIAQAVTAVIAEDRHEATWSMVGMVGCALGVQIFLSLFATCAASDLSRARRDRIEARAEELTDGPMTGGELRSLADMAAKARDGEEADALRTAARRVDLREVERKSAESLEKLRAANRSALAQLDAVRAARLTNAPSAFGKAGNR